MIGNWNIVKIIFSIVTQKRILFLLAVYFCSYLEYVIRDDFLKVNLNSSLQFSYWQLEWKTFTLWYCYCVFSAWAVICSTCLFTWLMVSIILRDKNFSLFFMTKVFNLYLFHCILVSLLCTSSWRCHTKTINNVHSFLFIFNFTFFFL